MLHLLLLRRCYFRLVPLLLQRTNTLDFIIDFALVCGFRKIVLCGIDMDDSGYFWESDKFIKSSPKRLPNYAPTGVKQNDPGRNKWGINVSEVVVALKDGAKVHGFEGIFLIKPTGALKDVLKTDSAQLATQECASLSVKRQLGSEFKV